MDGRQGLGRAKPRVNHMTNEEAKRVVQMLRDRFYGRELSDFEVIDRAVGSCSPAGFACLLLVLYYQAAEAWPERGLWILAGCGAAGLVSFLFMRRQRRLLLEARTHFIRHTPQSFAEVDALSAAKKEAEAVKHEVSG